MNRKPSLIRLVRNLLSFLAELSREDKFYWKSNSCKKVDCQIDASVIIYGNHTLTNVKVGYSSYISSNAHMTNTNVGKFCSIGPNIVSGWGIHPTTGISTHPAFYSTAKQNGFTYSSTDKTIEKKVTMVGNDVFIGANVTLLDGVTIGDGAVIGAGAVVSKDIPPYAIAVGCPIKVIKYRFSDDVIDELVNLEWWNQDKKVLEKLEKHYFDLPSFLNELKHITI